MRGVTLFALALSQKTSRPPHETRSVELATVVYPEHEPCHPELASGPRTCNLSS